MTGAPTLTRNVLAAMIDHTLLAPEATPKDIDALCAEAKKLGTYAVCVSPTLTSVRIPARAAGIAAAEYLLAGFADRIPDLAEWPVKLVIRGSTGPPPRSG